MLPVLRRARSVLRLSCPLFVPVRSCLKRWSGSPRPSGLPIGAHRIVGRLPVNAKQQGVVVVTGAGGFIGGALVAFLRARGRHIRGVDVKPLDEWYQRFDDVQNLCLDLNLKENCEAAAAGASDVYNLAANMGGMGFIEHNKALCM